MLIQDLRNQRSQVRVLVGAPFQLLIFAPKLREIVADQPPMAGSEEGAGGRVQEFASLDLSEIRPLHPFLGRNTTTFFMTSTLPLANFCSGGVELHLLHP